MQKALPLLDDSPFIVVSADVWTDYSFEPLLNPDLYMKDESVLAHLVMVENPKHNLNGDFALDSDNTGIARVRSLSESDEGLSSHINHTKSHTNNASYTYSGIGLYRPEFILQYTNNHQDKSEAVRQASPPQPINPYPLRNPLNSSIENRLISAEVYGGRWHDIGTIERLEELEKELV